MSECKGTIKEALGTSSTYRENSCSQKLCSRSVQNSTFFDEGRVFCFITDIVQYFYMARQYDDQI